MGYYTRVFCLSKIKPKISEIVKKLNSSGFNITVNLSDFDLESCDWSDFELNYDSERLPLLIELNECRNSDELAKKEIEEFIEFIGKPNLLELKKKKIIRHLKNTEYIVCIQLPTNDITDKGYDVNGKLMEYLEINHLGMPQADNEGFYQQNRLLLKME